MSGGYNPAFLGPTVDAPPPTGSELALPYLHFTVVFADQHRLARYTVVNIDGSEAVDIGPREDDNWAYDERVPREAQVGNEFYLGNEWGFDRGHLVRRLDPVWGLSREEGERAAIETFHFTNCAPQHSAFNRGKKIWQGLENYILDNAGRYKLRASVFSGPVFSEADPLKNGIRIPLEFWKVVVTVQEGERLHATAYLLSQADRVEALVAEFTFGAYRTFQVAIAEIEGRTGLDFSKLRPFDPFVPATPSERAQLTATLPAPTELDDLNEIVL